MDKTKILEMVNSLTEKERKALNEAVSVLWLSDSSDYINGLWDIVQTIVGDEIYHDEQFTLNSVIDVLDPFENSLADSLRGEDLDNPY